MGQGSPELLRRLLKDVSRSFYLTLRVLPGPVRPQIGLAYLLARASDTIADTDAISKELRLESLERFRRRISRESRLPLGLEQMAGCQSSPAERALLHRLEEALELLDQFAAPDQEEIRTVLRTIISGQTLDLRRFADADVDHISALSTTAELDDYTYRVAGCVGEFWTRMCRAHLFPEGGVDDAFLLANGVRFGKGLQLVNILRDLPRDLRLGRCYLPMDSLRSAQLAPEDLLNPAKYSQLRPAYLRHVNDAQAHLDCGWAYTNHLPSRSLRVRLACAWPILIGIRTLAKLRTANVLDPAQRIKIRRREVRQVLFQTVIFYAWPQRWRALAQAGTSAQNTLPPEASLAK